MTKAEIDAWGKDLTIVTVRARTFYELGGNIRKEPPRRGYWDARTDGTREMLMRRRPPKAGR